MNEFVENMKSRTKMIGVSVIALLGTLPKNPVSFKVFDQIIRSSTSIGANYRAACRAKSNADFINKLKIVEEETDETMYWLEVLNESKLISEDKTKDLYKELNEILSVVVASINTSKLKSVKYK
jgi:four helix bundle protein